MSGENRGIDLGELAGASQVAVEEGRSWAKVWTLSLAVGNGAGLLSLGSQLATAKGGVWFALLPAMWCFAAGVTFAGLEPLARARWAANSGSFLTKMTKAMTGQRTPLKREEFDGSIARSKRWRVVVLVCSWGAALGFGAGIFWALSAITFRWG